MRTLLPLFVMLGATSAWAADSNPDLAFYNALAEGGLAEVDAGKLAQDKGASPQVKDFGAMMVKDHSAANSQLQALAASKGIKLPATASMHQLARKAKLELLSGDSFDKSYIKGQVSAHRSTVKLLEKETRTGRDPDAKAFAQKMLPAVRSHLSAAQKLAALAAP